MPMFVLPSSIQKSLSQRSSSTNPPRCATCLGCTTFAMTSGASHELSQRIWHSSRPRPRECTSVPLDQQPLGTHHRSGRTNFRCQRSSSSEPTFALPDRPKLTRSEEHTSELQSLRHLVCRLLLEK